MKERKIMMSISLTLSLFFFLSMPHSGGFNMASLLIFKVRLLSIEISKELASASNNSIFLPNTSSSFLKNYNCSPKFFAWQSNFFCDAPLALDRMLLLRCMCQRVFSVGGASTDPSKMSLTEADLLRMLKDRYDWTLDLSFNLTAFRSAIAFFLKSP